jgi:hypothetical protein
MVADDGLRVSALPSEDEEQDWDGALVETRVSFLISSSFRKIPVRQLPASRSILSHYPLRC